MAKARKAEVFEPDLIIPQGTCIEVGPGHRAAVAERGALLRWYIAVCEARLGQRLSAGLIGWFFPDMERRCGVDPDWAMRRIESLRAGRGCSHATFARLVPLLVRLPQFGRPTWFPEALSQFECWIVPERRGRPAHIQRMDGSVMPMPPVFTEAKKEAA